MTPQQALPALRVVGQVRLTYIVAESPDGMYLVDQHAAHERVLFDRIVQGTTQREVQAQPLLAPAVVELTPAQVETLEGSREFLQTYGFEVEPFGGGNSYLLRAMPAMLTTQDPARSLRDVLDLAAFEGLLKEREDILAASVACHSAIRAGQSLTDAEMRALLEQLEVTDNPHTCPHGRPTLLHFSSYQMERGVRAAVEKQRGREAIKGWGGRQYCRPLFILPGMLPGDGTDGFNPGGGGRCAGLGPGGKWSRGRGSL